MHTPDAGVTLVEVLVTLVILAVLVGVIAMTVPRFGAAPPPGADGVRAFLQSARAAAITKGEPHWLSVWDNKIVDGTVSQDLAAGTVLDLNGGPAQNVPLLVRADGSIVGPGLRLATDAGAQDLFVWPVELEAAP